MHADNPVPLFVAIMSIILLAPLLSETVRLPGVVGLVIAGMLIGPFGLNLLNSTGLIEALATIGLIYLMFSAGLEVNLQQLTRVRNRAIVFGLLTFSVPLVLGLAFGLWIGLTPWGAVLLGSALSSHTLLALPVATRLGIMTNSAVSVTVGATVFTDVSAFLVLAIVTGVQQGDASAGGVFLLIVTVLIYAGVILLTLPRLGKWFFRHFSSPLVEFQFVLAALFVAALLAEAIGMHGVVGAFLAGLAINSALPHHSIVLGRILFIGESLFIPIFLLHSGMITDPVAFISDSRTLIVGVGLTVIAYIAKFIAAWITSRIYGYTRAELWVAFGLSQAQAAVTLPTILVGLEIGLFFPEIFGGTMMMILFTSFTSPLLVERFGKRLQSQPITRQRSRLFDRVLVPVVNPTNQDNLLRLGSLLAQAGHGQLVALRVIAATGQHHHEQVRQTLAAAEVNVDHLRAEQFECQALKRIDQSPAQGILNAALEQDVTLILLGWRGKASLRQSIFGTVLDEVVWKATTPVMVARLTGAVDGLQHVTLVLTPNSIAPSHIDTIYATAYSIGRALNVPFSALVHGQYWELVRQYEQTHGIAPSAERLDGDIAPAVTQRARPADLVIITTSGSRQRFQSSLGKLPEQIAAQTSASLLVLHTLV